MEKDPEIKGDGNSYTTEFRQYDPRLGRWYSLDPLMAELESWSPYVAFNNNPIFYTDPTGLKSTNDGDPPAPPTGGKEGDTWTSPSGKIWTHDGCDWERNDGQIPEVVITPKGQKSIEDVAELASKLEANSHFCGDIGAKIKNVDSQEEANELLNKAYSELYFLKKQYDFIDWEFRSSGTATSAGFLDWIPDAAVGGLEELGVNSTVANGIVGIATIALAVYTVRTPMSSVSTTSNVIKNTADDLLPNPWNTTKVILEPSTLLRTETGRTWTKSTKNVADIMKTAQNDGITKAVDVFTVGEKVYIIDGHHRVEAAKRLGQKVPVNFLSSPGKFQNNFQLQIESKVAMDNPFKVDGRRLNNLLTR